MCVAKEEGLSDMIENTTAERFLALSWRIDEILVAIYGVFSWNVSIGQGELLVPTHLFLLFSRSCIAVKLSALHYCSD